MLSAVLTLLTSAPRGALVAGWTVFGVAWQVLVVLLAIRSAGQTSHAARELGELARAGHTDRARIRARERSDMRPLLALLSGQLEPPVDPWVRTLFEGILAGLPLGILTCALLVVDGRDFLAGSVGVLLLAPTTALAYAALLGVRRRGASHLRAVAVTLAENNARRESERSRAEAHLRARRGEEG